MKCPICNAGVGELIIEQNFKFKIKGKTSGSIWGERTYDTAQYESVYQFIEQAGKPSNKPTVLGCVNCIDKKEEKPKKKKEVFMKPVTPQDDITNEEFDIPEECPVSEENE